MNCPNCGEVLEDNAKFCGSCGARIEAPEDGGGDFYGNAAGAFRLAPGYSRMIESESVLEGVKKYRRTVRLVGVIITVLPLIGFLIHGAITGDMVTDLLTGIAVSAVLGLTTLIVTLKKRLEKPFEGTVADKKHTRHLRSTKHHTGRTRDEYKIIVERDDGKRRKKQTTVTIYNYLQIGDRVRYLPQFPQPFEKYDKSRDAQIPCMFCGLMVPVENTVCTHCQKPLIR